MSAMLDRRGLLRITTGVLTLGVLAAAPLGWQASAEAAPLDPVAPVQRLNGVLLAMMKSARGTPFQKRCETLTPVVEQVFDLSTVLRNSVGVRWDALSAGEQTELMTAFRRYTVANYVANFDDFSGQSFEIGPEIRTLPGGDRLVQTSILSPGEPVHTLGYVMREGGSGWRAIDVLADGAISRVAVQRSDFRTALAKGGGSALVGILERKVSELSGGKLA